ncbi:hypothetical protein EDC94DRAFT_22941 [Helicostylum pulchrum]|nr:hypothetical protein EDC94DRAFT_22941 [Helicostylum pulchrum]
MKKLMYILNKQTKYMQSFIDISICLDLYFFFSSFLLALARLFEGYLLFFFTLFFPADLTTFLVNLFK